MTRTYSRSTFEEARAAWEAGNFGQAWEPYRRAAAEAGFIFPPTGTEFDDRDDDEPSQRAVVYRAIEDTPQTLLVLIRRSHSWGHVVAGIVADMGRRREDVDLAERDAAWERRDDPTTEQATTALRGILGRIATPPSPEATPHARDGEARP